GVQLAKDIFKQEGATTTKDAPTAEPNNDPTNRLRELKTLLDENLITTDEYNEKKQEILKTL
ncbi:MAG: SHOCT domain-containing protein, partial [Prevotella sp.]